MAAKSPTSWVGVGREGEEAADSDAKLPWTMSQAGRKAGASNDLRCQYTRKSLSIWLDKPYISARCELPRRAR